ncbi:MAG: hypothetical protein EOO48_10110 [Flavobacterium sp.]|nr:MAG: hypothetical protein EOO48_10110 [Flavobacterium sp.]
MNCKFLLILPIAALFTHGAFGQAKVFRFNEIRCRTQTLEWDQPLCIEDRVVYIAEDSIDVSLDKYYHLTIISTTVLPNHGAIYLCKDELQNDVTVTLVDDNRMFIYDDTKRFQVNFTQAGFAPVLSGFAETN